MRSLERTVGLDLPPLRRDAPGRLAWVRGSMPALSTVEQSSAAVEALGSDFYAASSQAAVRARRRLYRDILAHWGYRPFPATAAKLTALVAGLKAGRYRSFASVLSQHKVDSERLGDAWSPQMLRLSADAARSCRRGL